MPRIVAVVRAASVRCVGRAPPARTALGHTPGHKEKNVMWVILLEALGAGLLLGLIVWWTMFHGRKGGERQEDDDPPH